jgi:hypothetical protein
MYSPPTTFGYYQQVESAYGWNAITGSILLTERLDNWMEIQGMCWEEQRNDLMEMQTGLIHIKLFLGLIIVIHHDH